MQRTTLLSLALSLLAAGPAPAQGPLVLPLDPAPSLLPADGGLSSSVGRREQRIRLLRFQPGFLTEPVNLFPEAPTHPDLATSADDSVDWMTFTMGSDNP